MFGIVRDYFDRRREGHRPFGEVMAAYEEEERRYDAGEMTLRQQAIFEGKTDYAPEDAYHEKRMRG